MIKKIARFNTLTLNIFLSFIKWFWKPNNKVILSNWKKKPIHAIELRKKREKKRKK